MNNGWTKHLDTLELLWKNKYPVAHPRTLRLLERSACMALVALSLLSLANIRKTSSSKSFMDVYVLAFAASLTLLILMFGFGVTHQLLQSLATLVAVYRIADIAIYRAYFLLVKSQMEPWGSDTIRRSVIIVAVNFYETVVAFSLLYCIYPFFGNACGPTSSPHALGAADAVYFSFVTMLTVGYGDITPVTYAGRWVAVAQLATTMLFVVFLLPALVGVFSPALTSPKNVEKS